VYVWRVWGVGRGWGEETLDTIHAPSRKERKSINFAYKLFNRLVVKFGRQGRIS
jgi:hypothetical protein